MALSRSAHEQIKFIPGDEGWWRSDGEFGFIEIAVELVSRGVPEADVIALLERAYAAVASEYGG